LCRHSGELEAAEAHVNRAIELLGQSPGLRANALGQLAMLRLAQGRLAEAEAEGWAADRIRSTINTTGGFRTAGYKIILGNVLLAQNRPDEAIRLWEAMLDEQQGQALVTDHADAQSWLAWLLRTAQQIDASELPTLPADQGWRSAQPEVNTCRTASPPSSFLPEYKDITTR
jgi:tetratricopeptide (TPR) repeat protein